MLQKINSGWVAIVGGVVIVLILIIIHSFLPEQPSLEFKNYVSIGVENNAMSSLVIIAEKEGFFKKEGLHIKVKTFASSQSAMQSLLSYRVDLATSTNIPILIQAFKHNNFSIIATINETKNLSQVVVHKGRGIKVPSDLIGKRIGTVSGSESDYFTFLFLKHFNIPISSENLIYMPAMKLILALRAGYIDAVVLHEPYTSMASIYMPGKITYFNLPNASNMQVNLVVMNTALNMHFDKIKLMLQALIMAQHFAKTHRQQAQNDVIAFLGQPRRNEILAAWPQFHFMVDLPSDLISNLKAQASWVIDMGKGVKHQLPDFNKLVDSKPLEIAKSSGVKLPK